jgi:hypothetical protein
VLKISTPKKLSSFSKLNDVMKFGGFMELPENRERTLRDSLADCQASFRSEHDIAIEYEFRHCDLTVIYVNNGYYGSHIDFSRLKQISSKERIVKSCAINFWSHFQGYAEELGLTIVTFTQTKNSIRIILHNGVRLAFRYSKTHDDFLIHEMTSRYSNRRKMSFIYANPCILDRESMGFTVIQYLKHGGFFNIPGNQECRFEDLLMNCTTKESHSSITGTILGFQFKAWLLEVFYDEELQFIGENIKFLGDSHCKNKDETKQETDIHVWEGFKDYTQRNGIQIVEICRSRDVMIVFLDTGSNVHFNYSEEYGDYVISVMEGDGVRLRDSYRKIYKD